MTDRTNFDTMSYHCQENGVALIAIDVQDRSMNILTPEMHLDFGRIAEHLAQDEKAIGAVIYSAKPSFMAGGDLNRIVRNYDLNRSPEEAYEQSATYTNSLRKLETCGKPVAVAMNGTALGGGLELALACHYRVVVDNPKVLLGLPEVTLGLIPGGGGTQRLPRLIGLKNAASLILSGRHIQPQEALELGIVDAVTPLDDLIKTAETWVLESGISSQPWDQRGFKVPGGSGLNQMAIGQLFQQLTLKVSIDFKYNYPAPIAALRCLFNGTTVRSMDTALKIETREFSALSRDPVARNMIRTLFLNKGAAEKKSKGDSSSLPALKTVGLIGSAQYEDLLSAACSKADISLMTKDINAEVDLLIIAGETNAILSDIPVSSDRIVGLNITEPMSKVKAVEIIQYDDTSDDAIAHIKTLCRTLRKTPTIQKAGEIPLSRMMKEAYDKEGDRLMEMGISATLIENAAIAAGMPDGPLLSATNPTSNEKVMSIDDIKSRLLCSQALVAVAALEKEMINPIDADLISVLINRFPSYTGGAISFIDTLGLSAMIQLVDKLYATGYGDLDLVNHLKNMAKISDRIYPSTA